MTLTVRYLGEIAGTPSTIDGHGYLFNYAPQWLHSPHATPLSVSLPLSDKTFSEDEALPFFSGLLPDGQAKKRIADWLHISTTSDIRLLTALGGECAGTVSLILEDEHEIEPAGLHALNEAELSSLIDRSDIAPLLAPSAGIRLSLAMPRRKLLCTTWMAFGIEQPATSPLLIS